MTGVTESIVRIYGMNSNFFYFPQNTKRPFLDKKDFCEGLASAKMWWHHVVLINVCEFCEPYKDKSHNDDQNHDLLQHCEDHQGLGI